MKKALFAFSMLLLLSIAGCKIDSGLEPTRSGFQGTICFTGAWPEDTDEVRLAAAFKFPPSAITDIVQSDPLPIGADSVNYTFYIPPTQIQAVGVVWKEKDQPWDPTNIIGLYFPTENHLSPGQVTISERDEIISGIDVDADLGKAKRKVNSTLEGQLRVQGPWPAAATDVVVVASSAPALPTSLLDLMFSFPIKAGFDSVNYVISVQPGTYKFIAALLIEKDKSIGTESIRATIFNFSGFKVRTPETHIKNLNMTLFFGEEGLRMQPDDVAAVQNP